MVNLFSNASVIDKFIPKIERPLKNFNKITPVAVILNPQLPSYDRYKHPVLLDLFAIRIVDARSYRGGNRINRFITTLSTAVDFEFPYVATPIDARIQYNWPGPLILY